jgi:hypothetical protein
MRICRSAFVVVALLGSVAITGCESRDTKTEVDALQKQYVATHDTLVALWEWAEKTGAIVCRLRNPRPATGNKGGVDVCLMKGPSANMSRSDSLSRAASESTKPPPPPPRFSKGLGQPQD